MLICTTANLSRRLDTNNIYTRININFRLDTLLGVILVVIVVFAVLPYLRQNCSLNQNFKKFGQSLKTFPLCISSIIPAIWLIVSRFSSLIQKISTFASAPER